ncbi:MAG: hypothetical protein M3209_11880 [Acidobacteriota bacterium]|nr:hypothetical protein [Acidobacteriota bacterium]
MKLQFAALLFLLLTIPGIARSQDRVVASVPNATQTPAESRFEIIQVQYLRESLLLKLDKYTGEVYELVRNRDYIRDKGQAFAWQLTKWNNRPSMENLDAQRVNFQIFGATNNDNSVYLINVNNGDTWTIVRELQEDKESYWVLTKIQKK